MKKEETYKELKKTHDKLSKIKTKIMVTHMHPSETIFEYSGWAGSEGITKAIKELKPKIVICGHVHEAGGMQDKIGKTKIFNVAGVPTIIKV
jgi:Icc-related predicted phosphoesterase